MCQECGFYKGRLVIDMKAKNEARSARMQAKKDAIKESKNQEVSEEEQTNTIPNEGVDSPLEKVETAKSKEVDAPELAQAKTATPRKGQAS